MGPRRAAAGSRQTAALGILFTLLLAQGAQNLTSNNVNLLAIPMAQREFLSLQIVLDVITLPLIDSVTKFQRGMHSSVPN